MYTLEKRLKAIALYFELGSNAALTVRRLGYPDVTSLAHWVENCGYNISKPLRKG